MKNDKSTEGHCPNLDRLVISPDTSDENDADAKLSQMADQVLDWKAKCDAMAEQFRRIQRHVLIAGGTKFSAVYELAAHGEGLSR